MNRTVLDKLVQLALKGNRLAMGKILSILEYSTPEAAYLLSKLAKKAGRAHIIGVTGVPGAGKSTLIARLIPILRRMGYRVAVVAIDPSSPYTSGALLGDRLRMQIHTTDPGVFIRSIPTRGLKGGLALASLAVMEAFDALGYDKIIIETVGVGQAETDIMHVAHTIVVVTMPGAGDDIQALKAGVMEIGDIYVVNKADRPEASKTYEYIRFVLETGEVGSKEAGWKPVVLKASAVLGMGVEELAKTIDRHLDFIRNKGLFEKKILSRRSLMVKLLALKLLEDVVTLPKDVNPDNIIEAAYQAIRDACRRLEKDVLEGYRDV